MFHTSGMLRRGSQFSVIFRPMHDALLTTCNTPQALRSNIRELVDNIEVEEAKAEQLRKRIAASTGDTLDRQEELLRQLNKEVGADTSVVAQQQ